MQVEWFTLVGEIIETGGVLNGCLNVTLDTVTNVQMQLIRAYRKKTAEIQKLEEDRIMREMEANYG